MKEPEQVYKALAKGINNVLLVPFPLALGMFMASRSQKMDQRSSESSIDSQDYWFIRQGLINKLHGASPRQVKDVIRRHKELHYQQEDIINDLLDIEKLRKEQFASDEERELFYKKTRINPFPITRYSLGPHQYANWLDKFREKHKTIFSDGLFLAPLNLKEFSETYQPLQLALPTPSDDIPF